MSVNKLKLGKDEYSKEQVMNVLSRMKKAISEEPECKGQVGVERVDGRPEANISEDSDRFTACPDGRPMDSAIDMGGDHCMICKRTFETLEELVEHERHCEV